MSENTTGRLAVLLLGLVAAGGGGVWLGARLLGPGDPVVPAVDAPAVSLATPQAAPAVPAPETTAVAPEPEPPVIEETAEVTPEPEPEPEVETSPAVVYPTFDLVRVEADGTTLVAGAAGVGDLIVLLLDGTEVGRAEAGSDGKFVSFLDLGPSTEVRVLQLKALRDSGPEMSQEEVILAPAPAPQPEPAPGAEAVAAAPTPDPSLEAEAVADAGTTPEPEVAAAPTPEPSPQAEVVADAGTTPEPEVADTPQPEPEVAAAPAPDPSPEAEAVAEAGTTPEPEVADAPQPEPEVAAAPVPGAASGADAESQPPAPEVAAAPGVPVAAEPLAEVTGPAEETPEVPAPQVVTQAPVAQGVDSDQTAALAAGPAAPAPVAPPGVAQSPARAAGPATGAAPDPVIAPVQATPPTEVVVRAPGTPNAPGTETTLPSVPGTGAQATTATAAAPTAPAAAPTVLISRPGGIEVLQGPQVTIDAPAAPRGLALDTITYDTAGEVIVAGRGEGAASVRIYLDNQPVLTSPVGDDGQWRADLPQVDTGVYTLRVDQLAQDGSVTARVESPFQREDPVLLAQVQANAAAPLQVITVQPGNTLWGIARDRYGEGMAFVRVFDANRDRIRDPDLIYPGQIFDLPE